MFRPVRRKQQGSSYARRRSFDLRMASSGKLVDDAHDKLQEFAGLDDFGDWAVMKGLFLPFLFPADRKVKQVYKTLGTTFGIGAFIRMANFDVIDGEIIPSQQKRFKDEGMALVDGLVSGVTTFSTVFTLFLGTCCALIALNLEQAPMRTRALDDATPFASIADADVSVAGDAAQFFFGAQNPEAVRFRLIAYIFECVFLWLATASTCVGLFTCIMLYNPLVALPTLQSKIKLIEETPKSMSLLLLSCVLAAFSLVFSLLFISARCSAVMFLCACGSSFLLITLSIALFSWVPGKGLVIMHREAKRVIIWRKNQEDSKRKDSNVEAAAPAAPPSPSEPAPAAPDERLQGGNKDGPPLIAGKRAAPVEPASGSAGDIPMATRASIEQHTPSSLEA